MSGKFGKQIWLLIKFVFSGCKEGGGGQERSVLFQRFQSEYRKMLERYVFQADHGLRNGVPFLPYRLSSSEDRLCGGLNCLNVN